MKYSPGNLSSVTILKIMGIMSVSSTGRVQNEQEENVFTQIARQTQAKEDMPICKE